MTSPILRITDGTTTVDLLSKTGARLMSASPRTPGYKSGGVYSSGPFDDGRDLVYTSYSNVVESYSVAVPGYSADDTIAHMRDIRGLLKKAADYNSNAYRDDPVWLEARATGETNTRYALIVNASMEDDPNFWAQPFLQPGCRRLANEMAIAIERKNWTNYPPYGFSPPTIITKATITSTSDVANTHSDAVEILSLTLIRFGFTGVDDWDCGLIFRNVDVPQGAVITNAYITFPAKQSTSGDCDAYIVGRRIPVGDDIPEFAVGVGNWDTFDPNIAPTGNTVVWNTTDWTIDESYDTPDISSVVQETVDAGWVAGNDMTLYVREYLSTSNVTRIGVTLSTVLTIEYEAPASETVPLSVVKTSPAGYSFGNVDSDNDRDPTTEDGVFVYCGHTRAELTHIYIDDGTVFGSNLIQTARPFKLGPAVPATNDAIYFGIATGSDPDANPFSALAFDISEVSVYGAGTVTGLQWQYWNSAVWASLSVYENTSDTGSVGAYYHSWEKVGKNTVSWKESGVAAWTTKAVNGVTGWWIRAVWTIGTSATVAEQQNSIPYIVNTPYVEIQDTAILGDLDADTKLTANMRSDDFAGMNWLAIATRSVDRGANFTPYINFAQTNNHSGITIAVANGAAFATDYRAPADESITQSVSAAAGTPGTTHATITIDNTLAWEYSGRFLPMIRLSRTGGNIISERLYLDLWVNTTSEVIQTTSLILPAAASSGVWGVYFFDSEITVPLAELRSKKAQFGFSLRWGTATSATKTNAIADLILMPSDEWVGKLEYIGTGSGVLYRSLTQVWTQYLVHDHISSPKTVLATGEKLTFDTNALETIMQFRTSARNRMGIKPEARTRIWFAFGDTEDSSEYGILHSVRINARQRYLSARGAE